MGARDDLLRAAKACLRDKGHANTTTRDIVAAAGSSLASIGYHFRSKEALIEQALGEALREWRAELAAALTAEPATETGPAERFEALWGRVIALVDEHRDFWSANLDLLARGVRVDGERFGVGAGVGLGAAAGAGVADAGPIAKFYRTLIIGVMTQRLTDPDSAPTGRELAAAMRSVVRALG